jgi:hypothetical protein
MPNVRPLIAALAAAVLASACYRVTVVTGAAPAATVVDKPWTHSFVYGIVPPAPVNVSRECPNGVSQVVTQRNFLNGLVGVLTWSLYTPLQITATCAGGSRTSSLGSPPEPSGAPAGAPAGDAALTGAPTATPTTAAPTTAAPTAAPAGRR